MPTTPSTRRLVWAVGCLAVGFACARIEPGEQSEDLRSNRICAMRPLDACSDVATERLCALVTARLLDRAGSCVREREAACVPELRSCEAIVTPARAPDGACWVLRNNCLPAGWREAPGDDTECIQAQDLPSCPVRPDA